MPADRPPAQYARDVAEVAALRELTAHLHRLVPHRTHPDQALHVHIGVDTSRAVWLAAEQAYRSGDVEVVIDRAGNVVTRLVLGYGTGTRPESPFPAYRYAAVLTIAHVTYSTAALDAIDGALGEHGADR